MNSILNVHSIQDNPSLSNSINNDNLDAKELSAFYILAQAMGKYINNAYKSLDSQMLEQNEKNAILQELKNITDLEQRKDVIAFLLKTLGKDDADLKTWLTGLQNQNQDAINKIWKMIYGFSQDAKNTTVTDSGRCPLLAQIEKDDEREKKGGLYSLFLGDYELDPDLQKKRLALINQIKQLLKNPDEVVSNFSQLVSDFQELQNIVKQEQNVDKPATWWKKNVTGPETQTLKDMCKGGYKWYSYIGFPGLAIFDGIGFLIGGILSIPNPAQKTILSDTSTLATNGLLDIQSAESAMSIMKTQQEIDLTQISKKLQKATNDLNKYNDLLENSLTFNSKLITNLNYNIKV